MYIHTVHLFITKYIYQNHYDYIIALFACLRRRRSMDRSFLVEFAAWFKSPKGLLQSPMGPLEPVRSENAVGKRWALICIDPPVVKNHWPWTDELHQIILNMRTWNYWTLDFTTNYIVKEKSEAINNLHHPIWRFGVPSKSSWCRQMSLWAALLTKTSMRQNTKNDFANRFRYTKKRMLMLSSIRIRAALSDQSELISFSNTLVDSS